MSTNMDTQFITLLGDVQIPAPNKHFERISDEYIFYIIKDGHMNLIEDEISYSLEPRDILLLEPGKMHYGTIVNSLIEYSFIHISVKDYFEINENVLGETKELTKALQIKKISLPHRQFQDILQLYDEIKIAYHSISDYRNMKMHSLFTLFLIKLLEFKDNLITENDEQDLKASSQKLSLTEISNFLRQNCQKQLRSYDLEEIFHHNFDYMNRVFKAKFGMTIFQYLENYRICEAKKMLRTHAFSISQIAESLGFCNTYYFSKVFKKNTGVAPSYWIQMTQDKQQNI